MPSMQEGTTTSSRDRSVVVSLCESHDEDPDLALVAQGWGNTWLAWCLGGDGSRKQGPAPKQTAPAAP